MADEHKTIALADLLPAEWNPKTPIANQYRRGLAASLDHFGVRDTLKVWPSPVEPGKFIVLDGNQRLDVLKEKGLAEVECRVLADLDPDDAKLFTASFDRNHAQYSEAKIASMAEELKAKGADLIAKLLRPDASLVKPPDRDPETSSSEEQQAKPVFASIPFMVMLTREGHELAKTHLLKSKARLKQEERLVAILERMSERAVDDLVVELAVRLYG